MTSSPGIIVIGSGIGGLCCGALLARYGYRVTVCESHTIAGGAAHGFERGGYTFDSGPSLYSGMSYRDSTNPLRHVLDAVGEGDSITWANYDTWGVRIPEGDFDTTVGNDQFAEVLQTLRGDAAVQDWRRLQRAMEPLGKAATALPPAALRLDLGALQTVAPYGWNLLRNAPALTQSSNPFSTVLDRTTRDPFIRHWMNLLCFLLSGLPAEGTSTAEMAFMFAEWYRPGVTLDYPIGGSAALIAALVRGLEKFGGTLRLGAHVEQILVEGGRVTGVALRSGDILQADTVISNASIWDTLKLVPDGALPKAFVEERQATPECPSFLHLHLGIDGTGLPEDLACHYITVEDWALGIDAPQNLIVMSIPSVLDPSLAPSGKHAIHVYTPATEPYELWQGLDRRSPEYAALKQTRAEPLWRALERIIPDVRQRVEVELVGTPLTHERFLRCHRGSYGPAISAQDGLFPGPKTPLEGLLCVGGSTFPGIGLPAVAACGLITANTLASVSQHRQMLREVLG
ncbi:NAD(P)/FAD-dependent oxidoreductase [Nodosilinea sp. LEGE 06152]|uniref:phytoene desaturase family protein n=1 Tax=Nodosilinea sp. LEGE 06152 TaxID=2777966 RepID=UPI001881F715|nr:NAD(P)/FAD-dependent oxidoreductase [Nodosilinea sp. LEGE 06152]MBE9158098.1 NAD(P)/FAD-dependent oxidoreductase [Nodosilinea sp. LEGE 06152]